jgi:hypothetical protein
MRTFAELFCQQHHIPVARFAMTFFWLCLHRRALLVAPVMLLLNREFFAPDFELISRVGAMRSTEAIYDEIADFQQHPANRGWLHRRLKFRVSIERTIRVVRRIFAEAGRDAATAPRDAAAGR